MLFYGTSAVAFNDVRNLFGIAGEASGRVLRWNLCNHTAKRLSSVCGEAPGELSIKTTAGCLFCGDSN